jgi:predicted outer membrane repeat protein
MNRACKSILTILHDLYQHASCIQPLKNNLIRMKTKTFTKLTGIYSVILLFIHLEIFGAVIYVNHTATGANNGSNWDNAYTSLSTALLVATNGDEIWVAQGVYKPVTIEDFNSNGGIDAREVTFKIPNGVALYGGFNGTELVRNDRNWETNLTILSGDIDNNDLNLDGNQIAENTGQLNGNNAYHVIYTHNVNSNTIVDGFIITAGKADISMPINVNDPNLDGGGWFNRISTPTFTSSPTIKNTKFYGNLSLSEGGAFYTTPGPAGANSSPIFENCLFKGNKADNTGGAIYIGSFSAGTYNPVITNCKFENNEAYRRGGAIYMVGDHSTINSSEFTENIVTVISLDASTLPGSGGAINFVSSNARISGSVFKGNMATGNPTGPFEGGGGGAVYISTNDPQTSSLGASEPVFTNCVFFENSVGGNTAAWGGAVVHLSDAGILRPKYINTIFANNQAQNDGGAIANYTRVIGPPDGFVPILEPQFTNCTFTGNHAGQRGGAIYNHGYLFMGSEVLSSKIENSILWDNTAITLGPEIYNTGNNLVTYSLIKGSGGSGVGWNTSIGTDGTNNIDINPLFINSGSPFGADNIPANGDDGLRLALTSQAIDKGNNAAPGLIGITTDITGNARILGSRVDMGAYERAGIFIPDLKIYWLKDWPNIVRPCLSCPLPWAFLLLDRFSQTPQYIWKNQAQLIINEENAIITGEIINQKLKNVEFKVYIKLVKPQNWENWSKQGGTYIAVTPEAIKTAKKEHINWTYWKISDESYFEGIGNIIGKVQLYQKCMLNSVGFQLGKGANAWDSDFGLGGSFIYKGSILYKSKKIALTGIGSLNADAVEDEKGIDQQLTLKSALIEKETPELQINITLDKNLVISNLTNLNPGIYQINIYEITGKKLIREQIHIDGNNGTIPLTDIKPGIYIIKLISENKEVITKKVLLKD